MPEAKNEQVRTEQRDPFWKRLICGEILRAPVPESDRPAFSPAVRRWLLLGLVVLTVAPRAAAAVHLHALCDDAYYYLWVAEKWEEGRTRTALSYVNINVYPLILAALHQTGLEWSTAGKAWGVIVSGLTVFPVFWLVRQLFDDRAALAAGLLFAVHPELIKLSIEPIRDPTFWFLFVLSLSLMLRAAKGGRWIWPISAGVAAALAIHTRTEGWALLLPIVLWPLWNAPREAGVLRRLMRPVLAGSMIPAFILVFNLTLLWNHPRWEWGRFTPMRNFIEWMRDDVSREHVAVAPQLDTSVTEPKVVHVPTPPPTAGAATANDATANNANTGRPEQPPEKRGPPNEPGPPDEAAVVQTPPAPVPDEPAPAKSNASGAIPGRDSGPVEASHVTVEPTGRMGRAFRYVERLGQSFGYVHLLLMLFGLLACGGRILDRACLPLSLIFGGLMLAVWVRYEQIGTMNGRYFLAAWFLALPTAAVGGVAFVSFLDRRLAGAIPQPTRRAAVPGAVIAVVSGLFMANAVGKAHPTRVDQAHLGARLQQTYGPFENVEADQHSARVGFHAQGDLPRLSFYDAGDGEVPPAVDAVIVRLPTDARFLRRAEELGLVLAPLSELPEDCRSFRVFVRPEKLPGRRKAPERLADSPSSALRK